MRSTQDDRTHRDRPPDDAPSGGEGETARERDEASDRRARERRIGAAQIAAPSTRRWRRAGRFEMPA
jgi:hypothetical protein